MRENAGGGWLQETTFFGILSQFGVSQTSLAAMQTAPLEKEEQEEDVHVEEPAKVVLFNDDVHTFDEVIVQLMKAIKCTQTKAEALAWEVHTNGKAIVFSGELFRCVEVSHTLEEINLMTQIEM